MRVELEPGVICRHAVLAVGVRAGLLDRRRVEAIDSGPEGRVRSFPRRTGHGRDLPGALNIRYGPYRSVDGVPAPVVAAYRSVAHMVNDDWPQLM